MNTVFNIRNVIIAGVLILLIGGGVTYLILDNDVEKKDTNDITEITKDEANKMTDTEILNELKAGEEEIIIEAQTDDDIIDSLDDTIFTTDDTYEIINN